MIQSQDHILVMRFSAMGDVAMMVPVVYSLAQKYPNVRITVLSRPFARPLFEHLSGNVSFMGADVRDEYHGIGGLNKLYRRLAAKQFTHVADLHSVLRTEYLRARFNLDGIKTAHLLKNRSARRRLTTQKNKVLEPLRPVPYAYADVFAKLGYPVTIGGFKTLYPEGACDLAGLSFPRRKKEGGLWIGIAPFAGHKGKIYPVEKMEEVVHRLVSNHPDCDILFFGRGRNEESVILKWCDMFPQCCYASGSTMDMGEELKMMSNLDVMISMDSANMHLASLVNVPVVSVWGATHPYAGFMGWNQSEKNAVQLDMVCRPCSVYGGKPCYRGDYACLNNLAPEDIVNKAEYILKSR